MPSTLYLEGREKVFKLTDLYIPDTAELRKKILNFNREKMINPFELENEHTRSKKRKIKEDLKQKEKDIENAVKYFNVAKLAKDTDFMQAKVTESQIDLLRGKRRYFREGAIANIHPKKRLN